MTLDRRSYGVFDRQADRATRVPLLILDLDGTVRQGKDQLGHFVNGSEDVRVFPEAIDRMKWWRKAGGRIIGVSNQGGVALGIVDADRVLYAMQATHLQTGGLFDLIVWCEHHPDATVDDKRWCWCRKPKPGMVIHGRSVLGTRFDTESYPIDEMLFVGDRPEDQECAAWLGVTFMWADEWRSSAVLTDEDPK